MLHHLELSFGEYPGVLELGELADPSGEVGA